MRPAKIIKNLFAKSNVKADSKLHDKIITTALTAFEKTKKSKSAENQLNIWRMIAKSRITQVAAVLILLSAIYLLTLSDKSELERYETAEAKIAVISETPAELMSVISLSMTFRDGGMQAMERQLDKAERKVRRGLTEPLTIDQLLCELEECEEI